MAAADEPGDEVSEFLRGDSVRFEAIRASVRTVVRSFRLRPAALEEDLVQETLSRLFANLSAGAFRGESRLATYAQRIARYTCLDAIRRRRMSAEVDPSALAAPSPEAGPEGTLLRSEAHRRNLKVLASLSPECRELFRLIFVEGVPYAEIGERLGISEAAVKLRVHRCRLTARAGRDEATTVRRKKPLPAAGWRHYEKAEE
jgi:RNA polymerase sigma-70 factor (ECF subfamily)